MIALFKAEPTTATAKELVALLPMERFHQTHVLYEVERATPRKIPPSAAVDLCSELLLPQPPKGIDRFATWRATELLAKIGGEQAGNILSTILLTSKNRRLKEVAAKGLGTIKDYDAIPTLTEASTQPSAPLGKIAEAMGRINDARALPTLQDMANTESLSATDRLWTAAALAKYGKDYESNAALVREALPSSLEQTRWLGDTETIDAVAALIAQDKNVSQSVKTLEEIGTEEALEKGFEALCSLINIEKPFKAEKLQQYGAAAAQLADKLGSDAKSYYADIATLSKAVPDWFEIHQRVQPLPEHRSSYEAAKRFPVLARKLWIVEATRRLDLAAKQEKPNWESNIHEGAVRAISYAFADELVPVLQRIANESRASVSFHGKYKMVKFYNVRSMAAKILTEKTGKPHTFIDTDGRSHIGGWDPSQEK